MGGLPDMWRETNVCPFWNTSWTILWLHWIEIEAVPSLDLTDFSNSVFSFLLLSLFRWVRFDGKGKQGREKKKDNKNEKKKITDDSKRVENEKDIFFFDFLVLILFTFFKNSALLFTFLYSTLWSDFRRGLSQIEKENHWRNEKTRIREWNQNLE